jgi:hypothetical protein
MKWRDMDNAFLGAISATWNLIKNVSSPHFLIYYRAYQNIVKQNQFLLVCLLPLLCRLINNGYTLSSPS